MAQSPSSHNDGEVMEGLLCPICLYDLKTINQLQEHFESSHSVEDQDVFQALKGFFGKAKRKILKQENNVFEESSRSFDDSNVTYSPSHFSSDYDLSSQDVGAVVSHTSTFKKIRDNRINRYIIETNKLLIRLDRLISDAPEDPEKRKAHEKSIVPWISDGDVKLCPGCAKSFGLSRRRHHCRLCGGVMCQTCSNFIDFIFARKLTQPTILEEETPTLSFHAPLQRRGSNASLLSVVNLAGEPHIRICRDCKALLIRRNQQVEEQNQRPTILQKYERMREYMMEVERLAPVYEKMVDSLCSGEVTYSLEDAQEVKITLSKLAEGIDNVSKAIAKLEAVGEEISSKSVQLQSSIRMAACQFLRTTVLVMSQLPTEDEIVSHRKKREDEIRHRLQMEKEAELQSIAKSSPSMKKHEIAANTEYKLNLTPRLEARTLVSPDAGWSANPVNVVEDNNPMLQQMDIIRKYIKQARLDHKYDEVHMLEANLRELQREYQQQEKLSAS